MCVFALVSFFLSLGLARVCVWQIKCENWKVHFGPKMAHRNTRVAIDTFNQRMNETFFAFGRTLARPLASNGLEGEWVQSDVFNTLFGRFKRLVYVFHSIFVYGRRDVMDSNSCFQQSMASSSHLNFSSFISFPLFSFHGLFCVCVRTLSYPGKFTGWCAAE